MGFRSLIAGFLLSGICEVNGSYRASSNSDGLSHRAEALVPGLEHIGSRGNLIDLKCSGGVGNSEIRIRHDGDVCVHPVMNVAFQMKHDLFILRLEIKNVP